MELVTPRLLLRPWKEEDAARLYLYAKDPRTGPAAGWLPHPDEAHSLHIIRTVLSAPDTFAVCLREDGLPIGCISLLRGARSYFHLPETEGELGYWLGRPFWGRGLMTEAAGAVIRLAFDTYGLERLWGAYFRGNEASRRVLEKCGFTLHRVNENIYWEPTGRTADECVMTLAREACRNRATIPG